MTINTIRAESLANHNNRLQDTKKRKRENETEFHANVRPKNGDKPIKELSMFRTIFYGHAAYSMEIEKCSIPKNTSFTVYAPDGALLDKSVSDALANGENLLLLDIQTKQDPYWFFNRSLKIPECKPLNMQYPKTYYEGDQVPNFCLHEAELPVFNFPPIQPGKETEVVVAIEPVYLSELFEQYKGKEIHWAGCSFTRDDISAIGYGYASTLKSDRLKKLYLPPPLTEEVKRNLRAERFSIGST